ncbi:MAG: DUF262 domain-containing protein [Candidatus Omnitrophica bacterium]|nr:DUF262 domain-containing protein [Candidatus Omnitrophota bacterium]HOX54483.1 DUF262 domain-containing protein [Candidatus Omnitrophota bacterium]
MSKNPDLGFSHFSVKQLKRYYDNGEIYINPEYQRSFVWKPTHQRNLITSIQNGKSMGVLVIWKNKQGKYEILDGQQRIITIIKFLDKKFTNDENKQFDELSVTEQSEIEGYSIYYLELKTTLKEDEISDIFTRLQEGIPLNPAEKVNALRGLFRDFFMQAYIRNKIFFEKLNNHRFRARLLAAQLLLLELETNFNKKMFPNAEYEDFKSINNKYSQRNISSQKIKDYNNYLNFLGFRLQKELRAINFRDLISLYLLVSFLSKTSVNKGDLSLYIRKFAIEFINNLESFSIYKPIKPKNLNKKIFNRYVEYKQYARQATTAESFERRFKFILSEYKRLFPNIKFKDKNRLFEERQKIQIYFKQKCLCAFCKQPLVYEEAHCHHKDEYSKGGKTRISKGAMVHFKCHNKIHHKK